MWEQVVIAVIIKLVTRKASTNQIDGSDFDEIVKATKNPPKTLEKLFENPTVNRIATGILANIVGSIEEKLNRGT
ncbi:hypothetical protein LCGC14_1807330 [marine sediment metagenome]|uniref:Uncharacterized protein n=1 Tax=marine sediment metagenome TaxID=412755 RepID=A0A0F9GMY8_9ZZZZ